MRTTLDIPQPLFDEVIKETGEKSKRRAIIVAIQEYLLQKKKQALLASRGQFKIKLNIRKMRQDRDLS